MIFLLVGFFIRIAAYKELKLKPFWRIVIPNKIAKKGIYRLVRHPMYLGGLFLTFGVFLLLTKSYQVSFALLYLYFHFVLDRIDREEQLLIAKFDREYLDYMKQVKMLIPYIW